MIIVCAALLFLCLIPLLHSDPYNKLYNNSLGFSHENGYRHPAGISGAGFSTRRLAQQGSACVEPFEGQEETGASPNFQRFWEDQRLNYADKFLENWTTRTLQTDMESMKKVAQMSRKHNPLIKNWFKAKRRLSSGAVESLYLKAKLTMKKAFGFRTLKCLQIAIYHVLGKLSEPERFHRFC